MPGYPKSCNTPEKRREYINRNKKKNYQSTAIYKAREYTPTEDELVLAHKMTDRELSKIIHHSVQSIQIRRSRLKKGTIKKVSAITELNSMIEQKVKNHLIKSNDISDGSHTFGELYHFRMLYNALLFNEWLFRPEIEVYKTKRHNDGELCFDGNYFLVLARLPNGKIIDNHYPIEDWKYFRIPEISKSRYKFDGHSSDDVVGIMEDFIRGR